MLELARPYCVCTRNGATREECRVASGNKTSCRCACHREVPSGWADPYHNDDATWPHTWHKYVRPPGAREPRHSLCNKWGFEPDTDHFPLPAPPDGVKVCGLCRTIDNKEK